MLSYNVNILYNKIYEMIAWGKLAKISIFEAIEPHSPSPHPSSSILHATPRTLWKVTVITPTLYSFTTNEFFPPNIVLFVFAYC